MKAEKYQKVNGKVVEVTQEINVDQKILALRDDVTRLTAELEAVNAEIAKLESLK